MSNKLFIAGNNLNIQPRDDVIPTTKMHSTEYNNYHHTPSPNLYQFTSEAALLLYQKTIHDMSGTYTEVRTMNADPVSYDNFMARYSILKRIDGIPKWEPNTYSEFNYWLPKSKYYVGFGTWIGITLFYASQLVKKAVGFEGDPSAYASVFTNLKANSHRNWYNHTYVYPVAVREGDDENGPRQVSMRTSIAGNSGSGMKEIRTRKDMKIREMNRVSWDIAGYTLRHLLKINQIPVSKETFIKIDVESYECELLSSWLDWLHDLNDKPTLFVSFHGYVRCCSADQYGKILKLANRYKTVNEKERNIKNVSAEDYFRNVKCAHETLIFSDLNTDLRKL